MADPRIAAMGTESQAIFDCKRMAYGGFKSWSKPEEPKTNDRDASPCAVENRWALLAVTRE